MHPSSICSYYPTYAILDEIVSTKNYNNINLFIDLKNVMQTLYLEHAVNNLVDNSKNSKYVDSSIFASMLTFLNFHNLYSLKRNINIKFYIFFESGISYYHQNISKKYKISRRIDDLYGLSMLDRDLFRKVLNANYSLIEKALNKIPKTKVIRMLNLEADFIPYYLISRDIVTNNNETANLIYSNDHDLMQCLLNDNCFVFHKSRGKKIVKKNEVMKHELKRVNNIPDEFQPIAMSIIGDVGDDVYGIKGIGPKTFMDLFPELRKSIGSMEQLYDNVEHSKPIFNIVDEKLWNKHMNKVVEEESKNKLISNNLKMVSFELISRALDRPVSTEMIKKKQHIYDIIESEEIVKLEVMKEALERTGVYLNEDDLDSLYFNPDI
jgi:hypothetical protein